MQAIRIQRPEDSALVHEVAGAISEAEGWRVEDESEYLAAFRAWEEAGRSDTADAGAILNNLGSLSIQNSD